MTQHTWQAIVSASAPYACSITFPTCCTELIRSASSGGSRSVSRFTTRAGMMRTSKTLIGISLLIYRLSLTSRYNWFQIYYGISKRSAVEHLSGNVYSRE